MSDVTPAKPIDAYFLIIIFLVSNFSFWQSIYRSKAFGRSQLAFPDFKWFNRQ